MYLVRSLYDLMFFKIAVIRIGEDVFDIEEEDKRGERWDCESDCGIGDSDIRICIEKGSDREDSGVFRDWLGKSDNPVEDVTVALDYTSHISIEISPDFYFLSLPLMTTLMFQQLTTHSIH